MAKKITKKNILAVGGVGALLVGMAGAGVFAWWLLSKQSGQLPISSGASTAEMKERSLPSAVDEAQRLALTGNTEEANKKIQEALNQTNMADAERQKLMISQATIYANNGEFQKALDQLLEAEKILSTFTSSQMIGEMYEELGNKDKAIEYYKKALGQLNPSDRGYAMDKEYYEKRIKELGGQP